MQSGQLLTIRLSRDSRYVFGDILSESHDTKLENLIGMIYFFNQMLIFWWCISHGKIRIYQITYVRNIRKTSWLVGGFTQSIWKKYMTSYFLPPIWEICSSNWIIIPQAFGVSRKKTLMLFLWQNQKFEQTLIFTVQTSNTSSFWCFCHVVTKPLEVWTVNIP